MIATAERGQTAAAHSGAPHRWWVLLAVACGSLMSGLDSSVSNTVLPVIAAALGADVASAEWVVSVYLLVLSGLLLSVGRLGDMRGHRGVYLAGFGLFVASSAACAFAPSIGFLVAVRGLQALGAAMLAANSPPILTNSFPEQQRGRVLGFQATAVYLGLAIGPSLGGALAAVFGWGAVFFINVPVGLVAFLLSLRFVPADPPRSTRAEPFDVPGAVLFTVGLVLLILGLNQVHAWGLTSPLLLGCLGLGALALAAFVWVELRSGSPMLDLRLFQRRLFSAAVGSAMLNYMATFALGFLLPFYLIQARGLSPAAAGLVLTAQPILMAATAGMSGALSDRIGSRLPATVGMLLLSGGLALLSRLALDTPIALVAAALVPVGLGVGLFTSPNNSAALGAAPREQRGVASGVLATARNLGMVLGLGIGGAIFTTLLARTPGAPTPQAIAQAADTGLLAAALMALAGAGLSATRAEPARR